MSRLITLAGLVLGLCGCHHDAPTAPVGTDSPTGALPSPELVGFAVALQDLRDRILPALGIGPLFEGLGNALDRVEGALSEPDTAVLQSALVGATAAATEFSQDTTLAADLDVVLLVLQQIAAVARAPAEVTPDALPEPTDPRSEP